MSPEDWMRYDTTYLIVVFRKEQHHCWITGWRSTPPVGLVISRNRIMIDCNRHVCEMFHASREVLIGPDVQVLYPSADEYERLGARIAPFSTPRASIPTTAS
jgi:hypothetical protein